MHQLANSTNHATTGVNAQAIKTASEPGNNQLFDCGAHIAVQRAEIINRLID
jgi:hypothetical protein